MPLCASIASITAIPMMPFLGQADACKAGYQEEDRHGLFQITHIHLPINAPEIPAAVHIPEAAEAGTPRPPAG